MPGANVATLEPRAANIAAGARPTAIVPQTMDDAYRMAKAVCIAGLAPRGLDKPEACMVAILHGLEIGLTPMAALQRIAVVNGRPTIWGDGAMALVRASGLCEYVRETQAGAGDEIVATCEVKRRGEPEPIVRTFSVAEAKRASLWSKSGPWQQFPARMLQMRARAFALRDGFADVLGGLYLREEIEEERAGREQTDGAGGQSASARAAAAVRRPPPALPAPAAVEHVEFAPDPEAAALEAEILEAGEAAPPRSNRERLHAAARDAAAQGSMALAEFRSTLQPKAAEALAGIEEELQQRADEADAEAERFERGMADESAEA